MRQFVKKKGWVLFLLFLIGAGVCCYLLSGSGNETISRVVLISIDTCRADYLSCYGYPLKTTPNIDAIAAQGILFENAIAPAPLTLPSHCSMMTGTIPPSHGVHDNKGYRLGDSEITLAECLKSHNFDTGAAISAFVMDSKFGLDQGFDIYNDSVDTAQNAGKVSERNGMETNKIVHAWMEEHRNDKFFLFVHYYDPHFPYEAPEPYGSRFRDSSRTIGDSSDMKREMSARYAGEIAYVDHCIGQVVKKLKELDLFDSTLIIITSDHGEMLTEHGEMTHGFFVYQSAVKVPLIIKVPGRNKPLRINRTVGLVDIAPTVYSLLNIEAPGHFNGIDLKPYITEEVSLPERNIYCESFLPTIYGASSLFGLVSDNWKYIQATRPEMYDLRSDPEEHYNLISEQKQRARLLQDRLREMLEKNTPAKDAENKLTLDKESKAQLESLGYIAGRMVEESYEFDQTVKDPKDMAQVHWLFSELNVAFGNGQYDTVKLICEKLQEEDSTFKLHYSLAGMIAYQEKDYQKAAECLSQYIEYDPENHETFNNLGLVYYQLNNHIEAVKNFRKALALEPDSAGVYYNLGREFFRIGDFDEAITHFRRAVELDTEDIKAKNELDKSLTAKRETEKAIKRYHNMLQKKPDSAVAHFHLADIYLRQGKRDLAFQHCSKALETDPPNVGVRLLIVSKLIKLDKTELALKEYNRILKTSLDSLDGLNSIAWFQAASTIDLIYNPQQAVKHALKACEISEFVDPKTLDTLAVAYAAVGDYTKAIETAQKAIDLANSRGENDFVGRIKNRMKLYKENKPFIDIRGL